jgi:hypothetical protein
MSNPIYQQNGNHANGNGKNAGGLHKSSSSHFNGGVQPNGYRVAPTKIPTKAEIDYHLENFIMSRKIALNGGNELRIDDKNISLHLNNHSSPYTQKPQFPSNLHFSEAINESTIENRPKRPHSIAVSSPINNDLNVATLTRRQKITTPNIVTGMNKITTTSAGDQKFCSPINFNHFNGSSPSPGRFSLYTPPSPVAVSEANLQQKQPPMVPQRRSQSIPRQVMTPNFATPVTGVQTLNRPRSLDRYSNVANGRTTSAHSSPGMKQSMTFHGGQMLQQGSYQEIYEEVGKKKDRPMSFAYGTVPEQVRKGFRGKRVGGVS